MPDEEGQEGDDGAEREGEEGAAGGAPRVAEVVGVEAEFFTDHGVDHGAGLVGEFGGDLLGELW